MMLIEKRKKFTDKQESGYDFFAFISYCREDEKWAKWVQNKLETYRLPTKIKRENDNIPERIFPVFRDKTDLANTVLEEGLHKELADSQYLIVICSPECVKSKWVNKEIAYFRSLGREKKIIPFVIEGRTFSGDLDECLPEQIREITPNLLSIKVEEFGKREALIRLIATMLQLRPDELIRRDMLRRRKEISGICMAGLICAAVGVSALWYNTEHSDYYVAYATCYEIPEGIGKKLSASEQKNRANTYRITRKRGRVIRLELVDSAGRVCNPIMYGDQTDYPLLEYVYDSEKRLIEIQAYDIYKSPIITKQLSYGNQNQIALDFKNAKNNLHGNAMGTGYVYYESQNKQVQNNEVIRQINTYDEDGNCVKTMYYRDSMGTFGHDNYYGVYGKEYSYTEEGQIKKVSFLNQDGNVINCKYGYAGFELSYDEYHLSQWKVLDLQNQLCRGENHFALQKVSYDSFGNLTACEHFSETEDACNNHEGISIYLHKYENGCLVSRKYMDSLNQPTTDSEGVHELVMVYDKQKRQTGIRYYGVDGCAVNNQTNKVSEVIFQYDGKNRILEERYFDTNGNPTCNAENGAYAIRNAYKKDEFFSEQYFDAEGNPRCSKQGYAKIQIFYNEKGLISRMEYYDEEGNRKRCVNNYAAVEFFYDAYENNDKIQYYDEENRPCYSSKGISVIQRTYQDGAMVSERYYNAENQPMLYQGKYHEIRDEFDEQGNHMKRAYYNTEGRLTEGDDNYAYAEYAYDSYGNLISEQYFSRDCTPMYKYYQKRVQYDSRGNAIREEYETMSELNYYSVENRYDEYDNLIQKTYYDKNGALLNSSTLCTVQKFTYDKKKNLLTDTYCYADGKIEERVYVYDSFGNMISGEQFITDADGHRRCISKIRQSYDELGNMIRKEYMNGTGALQKNNAGFAVEVCEYSPEGYVVSVKYYDEHEAPMLYDDQYFCIKKEYDTAGNVTKTMFYDENENPVKEADGLFACKISEYSAGGLLEYEKWLNENNQPVKTGYSSMRNRYDELGCVAEKIYYNAEGEVIGRYVPYAFVSEVYESSQAAALGVQQGDMFIRMGDWNEFSEEERYHFEELANEILELKTSTKEILCYRIQNGEEQFIQFETTGQLGVRVLDGFLDKEKYEEIREKYHRLYE